MRSDTLAMNTFALKIYLGLMIWTPAFAADDFAVSMTDAKVLQQLEEKGLDFSSQVNSSQYHDLVAVVASELSQQKKLIDARVDAFADKVEQFNLAWLTSNHSKFVLAAVTHRLDRRYIPDTECGEVRLIYRLAYHTDDLATDVWNRLPMTVMLVFDAKKAFSATDCRVVANRMKINSSEAAEKFVRRYFSIKSPGRYLTRGKNEFLRMELNVQINRWPTIADETFSEQSHYVLKVLQNDHPKGHLVESTLENTPDFERLAGRPTALVALRNWLSQPEQLKAIDSGTVIVPKEFLATSAMSVSPYGMARLVNHPYSALMEPNESLTKERLHRLDLLSCAGCHQSQSVAGFHALGFEANPEGYDFTMLNPFSTHFQSIQSWRVTDLKSYLQSKSEPMFPASDRSNHGGMSDFCSLGATPNSEHGCKQGFTCDVLHSGMDEINLGQCVPEHGELIGSTCDPSILRSNFNPLLDQFEGRVFNDCGARGICAYARAGFPSGLCSQLCAESSDSRICTAVPTLGPFSECIMAKGKFRDCAKTNHIDVAMPRCQSNADCRLDYACVSTADHQGFCAPPYFMPDLTLSAHSNLGH